MDRSVTDKFPRRTIFIRKVSNGLHRRAAIHSNGALSACWRGVSASRPMVSPESFPMESFFTQGVIP